MVKPHFCRRFGTVQQSGIIHQRVFIHKSDNPREGAMIRCSECGMELEVISTDPFDVDFPLDEGEEEWEENEKE